jgi:hypothetical protein
VSREAGVEMRGIPAICEALVAMYAAPTERWLVRGVGAQVMAFLVPFPSASWLPDQTNESVCPGNKSGTVSLLRASSDNPKDSL